MQLRNDGMTMDAAIPALPLQFIRRTEDDMRLRAAEFLTLMQSRRTVRDFSSAAVPREVIEDALRTAGTAPSLS